MKKPITAPNPKRNPTIFPAKKEAGGFTIHFLPANKPGEIRKGRPLPPFFYGEEVE